jgi:hypothetical protein
MYTNSVPFRTRVIRKQLNDEFSVLEIVAWSKGLNVIDQWLAVVLCIFEIPGSVVEPNFGNHDWRFKSSLQSFLKYSRIIIFGCSWTPPSTSFQIHHPRSCSVILLFVSEKSQEIKKEFSPLEVFWDIMNLKYKYTSVCVCIYVIHKCKLQVFSRILPKILGWQEQCIRDTALGQNARITLVLHIGQRRAMLLSTRVSSYAEKV